MTPASARRELGAVIVICLVGATAVLLASSAVWGRVRLVAGEAVPVIPVEIQGREAAPTAAALGLLGLAAVAALVATRGLLRQGVGVVLLVAGVVVGVDATRARGRFVDLALASSPGASADTVTTTGWPWLAVAGGVLLVLGGVVTGLRGGRWRPMSPRYDAPGARVPSAGTPLMAGDLDPDAAWRALDRGEDPTESR